MKKIILILTIVTSGLLSNAQSYATPQVKCDSIKSKTEKFIDLVSKLDLDSATIAELQASAIEVANDVPKVIEAVPTKESSWLDWINWIMLIGGVFAVVLNWIVRLIPTRSKYAGMLLRWVELLSKLLGAIVTIVPNRMKGGGKH